MILIGLGSNLPGPDRSSRDTVEAALSLLDQCPLRMIARSGLWRTRPVPVSDQPWFLNAIAAIETVLSPDALLDHLHGIERRFGRHREAEDERNAARTLDLDLIDYDGLVSVAGARAELPHPRATQRGFVLKPLAEIAPDWRCPRTGTALAKLLAVLPDDQAAERLDD